MTDPWANPNYSEFPKKLEGYSKQELAALTGYDYKFLIDYFSKKNPDLRCL